MIEDVCQQCRRTKGPSEMATKQDAVDRVTRNASALLAAGRRLLTALMLAAVAAVTSVGLAAAQQVVVIVNGDPVTAYDIEQRIKLIQISTQKTPSRQETIEELIDEKLKIQLLRRFAIEGMDTD